METELNIKIEAYDVAWKILNNSWDEMISNTDRGDIYV